MIAASFENSTYCGADCLTCVRKKMSNVNQNMTNELFAKIIDSIMAWNKGELEAIGFVGTGDPLMDPEFGWKLKYVKENTPLKIHLTNTCHLLDEEKCAIVCEYVDTLKISHYAMSEDVYRKVHGGGLLYLKIVEQIKNLLSREKRPDVSMSFLVIEENKHEMEPWIKYWEPLCEQVDVWKPHNWGGNYGSASGGGIAKTCRRPGRDFSIHVDGRVSVCCLDVCENLIVGDLKEESWEEIINGKSLERIIKLHEQGRLDECGICGNCDLIYDRADALIYSSNSNMKVGMKAGYASNSVDFSQK